MLLGTMLMLSAALLLMNNQHEDDIAQEHVQTVVPAIREQIWQVQAEPPAEVITEISNSTPIEYLNPEDLVMTEKVVNGYAYIGYLTIPDLGLELPVMSGWDNKRLQISPCHYTGSTRGEDLVIMAHNYKSHFGRLSELSVGASVQFIDMDGQVWNYQVVALDVLAAESVEEMTAGEYDLTLFTCALNRITRVTVRCNLGE
jgi:sortase A